MFCFPLESLTIIIIHIFIIKNNSKIFLFLFKKKISPTPIRTDRLYVVEYVVDMFITKQTKNNNNI